jgi:hypothetical protein
MIVAGVVLLAAAVVAFVIGLLAGAAGWLVASLACTAVAAVLLVLRVRTTPARRRPLPPAAAGVPVWVVDGEPDYHRPTCPRLSGEDAESVPRTQAVDDGFTPCPECDPETSAALS